MGFVLGKTGILLLLVLTAANAQCFAVCSFFSCTNNAESQSSSDCHRKSAPTEHRQNNATCGHPLFLTEAGPQTAAIAADSRVVASFDSMPHDAVPHGPQRPETADDPSPPPLRDAAANRILRI
ncbi:MAG: hypothetical protein HYZ37_07360 [Candidatus Solibacter usitatus]|nr:hypothetical protein [Candidatus Solibacter usitatus]